MFIFVQRYQLEKYTSEVDIPNKSTYERFVNSNYFSTMLFFFMLVLMRMGSSIGNKIFKTETKLRKI